jgi:hypothetical protein
VRCETDSFDLIIISIFPALEGKSLLDQDLKFMGPTCTTKCKLCLLKKVLILVICFFPRFCRCSEDPRTSSIFRRILHQNYDLNEPIWAQIVFDDTPLNKIEANEVRYSISHLHSKLKGLTLPASSAAYPRQQKVLESMAGERTLDYLSPGDNHSLCKEFIS